jgi:PhnB protein
VEKTVTINPYLMFDGDCKQAFEFYQQCLGGEITAMFSHGEMPGADQIPAEQHQLIMHARLVAGNAVLMGSDSPPEYFEEPKGTSVSLLIDTPEEAERVFHALADGGNVRMPIEETFWAVRFGMLTDRFGTPWMVNCEKAA